MTFYDVELHQDGRRQSLSDEHKNVFNKLNCRSSILLDEWMSFLPVFARHNKERFCPVSIEHVLKHSILRKGGSKMPGCPEQQPLTIHMLNTEHKSSDVWKDFSGTQLQLKDHDESYYDYGFWDEAPIYVRIVHSSECQAELRCMFLLSAHQTRNCFMWSKPIPFHVQFFDMALHREDNVWHLTSVSWWNADRYVVTPQTSLRFDSICPQRPILYLSLWNHRIFSRIKSVEDYNTTWNSVAQVVDIHNKNSSSTWSLLPLFNGFYN